MRKHLFAFVGLLMLFHEANCKEISEKGYWIGEVAEWHVTDKRLAQGIANFLKGENASTVVDFGCGEGDYVRCF
jgi:hypothetical protein